MPTGEMAGGEHSDLLKEAARQVLHKLTPEEVTQQLVAAPRGNTGPKARRIPLRGRTSSRPPAVAR